MSTGEYHDADEVLGKAFDARLMRRLVKYLKPYRAHFFAALLLGIGMTALALAPTFVVRDLINSIEGSNVEDPSWLVRTLTTWLDVELLPTAAGEARMPALATLIPWFAIVLLGLEVFRFFVTYGALFLIQILGQRVLYDLRVQLFRHFMSLPLSFFQRQPVGRLVTRLSNDIEALNEMFSGAMVQSVTNLLMVVGVTAALLVASVSLGLKALAVVPLIIVVTVAFQYFIRKFYRLVRKNLSRINAFLAEQVSGMREVQLFNREARNQETFAGINEDHYKAIHNVFVSHGLYHGAIQFLNSIALALVLWFGGMRHVANGTAFGLGDLALFIQLVRYLFRPIMDLANKYQIFQAAMAAAERVFGMIDTKNDLPDPANPADERLAEGVRGEVRFDDVHFRYRPDEPILKGISFTVKPGEHVALVGHTGSGKTTCISLLGKYYVVEAGRITIDGVDVNDLNQATIRQHIAAVHQDVFCFTGTIGENITLGNPAISHKRMVQCAEAVNAHRFIERLPGGYDAPVSPGGKTYSLGERQLLAFARALAVDPAILVLDEATASIDTPTEKLIQDALQTLIKGRTAIIIAHRLSTITSCDCIHVLDQGRLIESGTHAELLAQGGHYANLYRLQFAEQAPVNDLTTDRIV